ncbi:MAG: ComEC/Rec2 family competence protein [Methanotrichaceae archaeon]
MKESCLRVYLLTLLSIIIITATVAASDNLVVHFLNVGQGDSILIQFAGKNALIDGGDSYSGSKVSSYLKSNGVKKIDLIIATHSHPDHVGGLQTILNTFEVGQAIDGGEAPASKIYDAYLDLIAKKKIVHNIAEAGQMIDFDSAVKIEVLSPIAHFDNPDDNSVILRVTYGNISFLFMGDAGFGPEKRLLNSSFNLKSDILKVGNHGSDKSTSSEFLSKVKPRVAIIEVGKYNVYGYPSQKTLSALQSVGSKIYRTDSDGDIVVTTDGMAYSVATQKTSENAGPNTKSIEHISKSSSTLKAATSNEFQDFSVPNLPNAWR